MAKSNNEYFVQKCSNVLRDFCILAEPVSIFFVMDDKNKEYFVIKGLNCAICISANFRTVDFVVQRII